MKLARPFLQVVITQHGEYIVSNADMPGFTRTDQKYMASLILAQRGRLSKVSEQLHSSKFAVHVLALRLAVIFAHARKTIQFPLMTVSHRSKKFEKSEHNVH